MASEIVMALVGVICSAISGVVTFLLTRRKYNTEVDSQQIINMNEAFDLYKKTMEESIVSQRERMEETIKFQNSKIETLQKENDSLKEQVNNLQKQLTTLVFNLASKNTQSSVQHE